MKIGHIITVVTFSLLLVIAKSYPDPDVKQRMELGAIPGVSFITNNDDDITSLYSIACCLLRL